MKLPLYLLLPFLLAADTSKPAVPVDSDCLEYAQTHTLVRDDVLSQLNADHKNLPVCEEALTDAQQNLVLAKKDLIALQQAALEQKAVIAELKAQKQVLETHITRLEMITCPDPTIGDQFVQGWESVDGMVGLGAGYALGTGMCIGIAWVFNQPGFTK